MTKLDRRRPFLGTGLLAAAPDLLRTASAAARERSHFIIAFGAGRYNLRRHA